MSKQTLNQAINSILNFESIYIMSNLDQTIDNLDETLDDLADLPQQKPFPEGTHVADMTITKNEKKAGAYTVKFKYVETLAFANPNLEDEAKPAAGDEAVVFLNTKKKDGTPNTLGQGQLKLIASPLAQLFGTANVAEICTQSKAGVRVAVTNKVNPAKGEYDESMRVIAVQVA